MAVAVGGPLITADEKLGRALSGEGPGGLAEFFADLGGVLVAGPFLLLVLLASALHARARGARRWWLPAAAGALAMAAVPLLVAPLKALIDRPGPPGTGTGTDPSGGYYPSGHTATAMVAYGIAVLLALPLLRALWRRLLLAAGVLLNLAVGCGLVLRGYHWPLDVVGSWLLCPLILAAFAGACARFTRP
ncbi:phosphatase PAP2 family protein [Streptomyces sp. NA04227]|uniref:phosphatase PAP2 family protein n=1 Tax=Streptomyces sp. NA04227 TaxID=2742136 RepID=UPI0020CA68FE|nr:phosphatase PAP2 family protein [Streptomyces sp. NA04227]